MSAPGPRAKDDTNDKPTPAATALTTASVLPSSPAGEAQAAGSMPQRANASSSTTCRVPETGARHNNGTCCNSAGAIVRPAHGWRHGAMRTMVSCAMGRMLNAGTGRDDAGDAHVHHAISHPVPHERGVADFHRHFRARNVSRNRYNTSPRT